MYRICLQPTLHGLNLSLNLLIRLSLSDHLSRRCSIDPVTNRRRREGCLLILSEGEVRLDIFLIDGTIFDFSGLDSWPILFRDLSTHCLEPSAQPHLVVGGLSMSVHFDAGFGGRDSILLGESTELNHASWLAALVRQVELVQVCSWRDASEVT